MSILKMMYIFNAESRIYNNKQKNNKLALIIIFMSKFVYLFCTLRVSI